MHHALQFDLSPDSLQGPLRIRVRGSLSARTAPQLITFLERRAHLPESPDLLVSLCGLEHIDPAALDEIMRSVAELNDRGVGPAVTVDLPVSTDASAVAAHVSEAREQRVHQIQRPDDGGRGAEEDGVRLPTAVPVRAAMTPIRATISTVQSLQEAAERIGAGGDLVVLSLSHHPLGLVREERLRAMRRQGEEHWRHKRCASLVETFVGRVPVDAFLDDSAVAEALPRHQEPGSGPLLVVDGDDAVGFLTPEALRRHLPGGRHPSQERADRSVGAGGGL